MNPLDEQNDSQMEETNRQTRKGKSRFRGWLTTIVRGNHWFCPDINSDSLHQLF